jgi:hypothetical protein
MARLPCLLARALLLATVPAVWSACSLGKGSGAVHSDRLQLAGCWDGVYDMAPDFFAGVPYRSSFQIRIQRGGDIQEVSDGVSILIDDVHAIRGDEGRRNLLGKPLDVGLPPEVTPPGVPIRPSASPPFVHLAIYLHNTCHQQNSALYAVRGVISFDKLFNADPNETNAEERLTSAVFDVMVGDPRDQPPGGGDIPEAKLSRVSGWFHFYFQRGKPGQPFP